MATLNSKRVHVRTSIRPNLVEYGRVRGVCLFLLAVLAACPIVSAQEAVSTSSTNPKGTTGDELSFDRAQYLAAFDQVFETVRDTHWDSDLIESVWIPAREKYRERIENSDSRKSAVLILQEMLMELKQSHFHIIPAETYIDMNMMIERGGNGWSGLDFRVIQDQFIVTKVAPDSPAAQVGIEVGWLLQEIQLPTEEEAVTPTKLKEIADKVSKYDRSRTETLLAFLARDLTSGAIGQSLQLTFLDNQDQRRQLHLQMEKGPGAFTKFGNLPGAYITFEYRPLPNKIGYIQFNAFLDAPRLIKEYQAALHNEQSVNGIVIDLRGNMGGLAVLAMGMSGWLVDEPHSLGRMKQKANTIKLTINPRKPRFSKPVAILVDECSVSCAELFPGGLQELKAARIFGSRTAGQVIPAGAVKLPTGDGFLFAMAGLESESGYVWEGNGVQPDEPVELTRELLQRDPDPALTAALKWISESNP